MPAMTVEIRSTRHSQCYRYSVQLDEYAVPSDWSDTKAPDSLTESILDLLRRYYETVRNLTEQEGSLQVLLEPEASERSQKVFYRAVAAAMRVNEQEYRDWVCESLQGLSELLEDLDSTPDDVEGVMGFLADFPGTVLEDVHYALELEGDYSAYSVPLGNMPKEARKRPVYYYSETDVPREDHEGQIAA